MAMGILINPNSDPTAMDMWAACSVNKWGFVEVMEVVEISLNLLNSQNLQYNFDYWIDYTGQCPDPSIGNIYQLNDPLGSYIFTTYAGAIIDQNSDPTAEDTYAMVIIDPQGNPIVQQMPQLSVNNIMAAAGQLQFTADFWVDMTVGGQTGVNQWNVYDPVSDTFSPGTPDPTVAATFVQLHTDIVASIAAFNAAEQSRAMLSLQMAYDQIIGAGGFLSADEETQWQNLISWIQQGAP